MNSYPTSEDVVRAKRIILGRPEIQETPLMYSPQLSQLVKLNREKDVRVFLKLESLQMTRSYKVRGAYHAVTTHVAGSSRVGGLVAASAGNHAQGVAYAALSHQLTDRTHIFVPESAPPEKIEATKKYGVTVHEVPGSFDEVNLTAQAFCATEGMHFISPFDNVDVITGQGTVGLEVINQLSQQMKRFPRPSRVSLIAPVGGGGLMSGICSYVHDRTNKRIIELNTPIRTIGAEPRITAKAGSSIASRTRDKVSLTKEHVTVADGARVAQLGELTYRILERCCHQDDFVAVDETKLVFAMRALHREVGIVVEGAGALPLASVLRVPAAGSSSLRESIEGQVAPSFIADLRDGEYLVLVISGGNVKYGDFLRSLGDGVS